MGRKIAYWMPLAQLELAGLVFVILLIFAVLIGLCVGLDARSRGIKPAGVWALVAALAPGLVGVIGYLIVRYLDDRKATE